jgi:hypothetical protein
MESLSRLFSLFRGQPVRLQPSTDVSLTSSSSPRPLCPRGEISQPGPLTCFLSWCLRALVFTSPIPIPRPEICVNRRNLRTFPSGPLFAWFAYFAVSQSARWFSTHLATSPPPARFALVRRGDRGGPLRGQFIIHHSAFIIRPSSFPDRPAKSQELPASLLAHSAVLRNTPPCYPCNGTSGDSLPASGQSPAAARRSLTIEFPQWPSRLRPDLGRLTAEN